MAVKDTPYGQKTYVPLPATPTVGAVVAGANITVDNTDPTNPIVASTASAGSPAVSVHGDGTGDKQSSSQVFVAMTGVPAANVPAVAGDILLISYVVDGYVGLSGNRMDVTIGIAGVALTDFGVTRCTFTTLNFVQPMSATRTYVVQAGDIVAGNVAVALFWRTPDAGNTINMGNAGGLQPSLTVLNTKH